MKRWIATGMLAALAGGCGNFGKVNVSRKPPRPVEKIDEIMVSLTPAALNWDDMPGADGFQTRVHLFQLDEPLAMPVKGALEFALYEGRGTARALGGKEPFRVWRFEGDELSRHLVRSMIGWGYSLPLGWGQRPPTSASVTLLARYRPPTGKATVAKPIYLAMAPK